MIANSVHACDRTLVHSKCSRREHLIQREIVGVIKRVSSKQNYFRRLWTSESLHKRHPEHVCESQKNVVTGVGKILAIEMEVGLRQGSVVSPHLFVIIYRRGHHHHSSLGRRSVPWLRECLSMPSPSQPLLC